MNFIIQQSRSFEGACVPLRLTSCLFPVLDSQLTATELFRSDLELSSRLLHSLEDILLRTVLFIILLSCLRSDIVILDTLIAFTYLLTYLRPRGYCIHFVTVHMCVWVCMLAR